MASKYLNRRKHCSLGKYNHTFNALSEIVENDDILCKLTGKEQTRIIELLYEQRVYGENCILNEYGLLHLTDS